MSAQEILVSIRLILAERLARVPTRGDNQRLSVAIYDLHNASPNIELFNIWQALSHAKKDPVRFEQGVGRLNIYLQSSPITSSAPALRSAATFYNQGAPKTEVARSAAPMSYQAPAPLAPSSMTVERTMPQGI